MNPILNPWFTMVPPIVFASRPAMASTLAARGLARWRKVLRPELCAALRAEAMAMLEEARSLDPGRQIVDPWTRRCFGILGGIFGIWVNWILEDVSTKNKVISP